MAVIDLDARRAARTEAENKPHELVVGGRTYLLRPRLPLEFTDLLSAGKMGEAMQLLLIDPGEWEDLRKAVPDDDDLAAVSNAYAVSLPESPSSASSSQNGSPSSRPTSSSSTGSTSPARASGRKRSGSAGSTP